MRHQLSRLIARRGESEPGNDIVKPPFQIQKQSFARNPLLFFGLGKIIGELIFEDPVNSLNLLLLAQLNPVPDRLGPVISAVLSRRKIALLNGAGIPEASIPFEEELHALPPA
jgi:hypothetical protein